MKDKTSIFSLCLASGSSLPLNKSNPDPPPVERESVNDQVKTDVLGISQKFEPDGDTNQENSDMDTST